MEQPGASASTPYHVGVTCCGRTWQYAVIGVNATSIVLMILSTLLLVVNGGEVMVQYHYASSKDEVQAIGLLVLIDLVFMSLFAVGIYGAVKFHQCLVMVPLSVYMVFLLIGLVTSQLAALIWLFFAIPHLLLIREIRRGVTYSQ